MSRVTWAASGSLRQDRLQIDDNILRRVYRGGPSGTKSPQRAEAPSGGSASIVGPPDSYQSCLAEAEHLASAENQVVQNR